jgi:hypothetical protein
MHGNINLFQHNSWHVGNQCLNPDNINLSLKSLSYNLVLTFQNIINSFQQQLLPNFRSFLYIYPIYSLTDTPSIANILPDIVGTSCLNIALNSRRIHTYTYLVHRPPTGTINLLLILIPSSYS